MYKLPRQRGAKRVMVGVGRTKKAWGSPVHKLREYHIGIDKLFSPRTVCGMLHPIIRFKGAIYVGPQRYAMLRDPRKLKDERKSFLQKKKAFKYGVWQVGLNKPP